MYECLHYRKYNVAERVWKQKRIIYVRFQILCRRDVCQRTELDEGF
jgi:hypothetical protein